MTYIVFIALILIIAVLLILIIMVQNPKGGGLDSSFGGGGSQLGGVQNTNKFLDRTTWTLAISLFSLILLSNFVINRGGATDSQINTDGIEVPAPKTDDVPKSTDDKPTSTTETPKGDSDTSEKKMISNK